MGTDIPFPGAKAWPDADRSPRSSTEIKNV
jgi:hypothetical protein